MAEGEGEEGRRGVNHETGMARYDAMCQAIAECSRVDEAKDIRDRARALEVYAAQAMNTEAEHKAVEIRIRAERRAGELLKLAKQNGQARYQGRPSKRSCAATIAEIGISKDQSAEWQRLAEIPPAEFEAAISRPGKPSTDGILARFSSRPVAELRINPLALNVWGRIRAFESELMVRPLAQLFEGMTESMQDDIVRIFPLMIEWLTEFEDSRSKEPS